MDDYQNHAVAMLERTKENQELLVKTQVERALSEIRRVSERGRATTNFYVSDSYTGAWREAMIELGYSVPESRNNWYQIYWSETALALPEKRKSPLFHGICHKGFCVPGDIQAWVRIIPFCTLLGIVISFFTSSVPVILLSTGALLSWMSKTKHT